MVYLNYQVRVHVHETSGNVTGEGMCVCVGCGGDGWEEDTTSISSLVFFRIHLFCIEYNFQLEKIIYMVPCRETVEGLRLFSYLQIFETVCLINSALFSQIIKILQEIKPGF